MNDVSAILKVEDKDGNVLEEYTKKERTVMSDKVARMINSILSDNDARSFIFGAQNKLILKDRPVAAKTGTTNDWRDGWTIGYTPSIVAGVWVGNNDNSKMKKGSDGGIIAAPIWNEYMEKVLVGTPVEKFKDLGDVKTGKPILDGELDKVTDAIKIDKFSGLLATEYTPPQAIKEVNVNQNHCILYYIDKNNPLGDTPKDPNKDPQFVNWEKAVVEWVKKQKKDQGGEIIESIPTEKDNVHLPENMPSLEIISPTDKQTINNSVLTAQIQTSAKRGVVKAEYYLNNNLLATSSAAPFDLNKSISFLNNGYHNLKVRVCDDVENCTEKSLDFNLVISGSVPQNKTVVSFVYPKNGLAVNKIDFPLKLKVGFSGLEQIAKVNIYLVDSTKKQTLITSLGKPSEAVLEIPLENAPEKGEYQIFAEAYNWNGDVSKTKEVFLTISN
ncbi:MAG: Ig-like domain-containing protein [Planctomycetes bacterium]|nr:Ig-like domain-containing protein [Planctomycetota bacterium]